MQTVMGASTGPEVGDLLGHVVFEDAEVAARNVGNEAALVIEDGHVHIERHGVYFEVRLFGDVQLYSLG